MGVSVDQVSILQQDNRPVQAATATSPVLELGPALQISPLQGEREWIRGPLSKEVSYSIG